MAVVNSAAVIFGAKLTVIFFNFEFKIASFNICNFISNNFPHLHNVNRGLETSANREKQLCKRAKEKLRNRPLVIDKTQPQRWQERVELEDKTPHTTYIEFQPFFLLYDTPNEVCKQAKFEKNQ